MIRDEENKVKKRDTYIVTKIEKNHASCVKTSSKSGGIPYTVKLETFSKWLVIMRLKKRIPLIQMRKKMLEVKLMKQKRNKLKVKSPTKRMTKLMIKLTKMMTMLKKWLFKKTLLMTML